MNIILTLVFAYSFLSFGYLIYKYAFSVYYSAKDIKQPKLKTFPKVSIIIPCYNEAPEDLEKCIVSSCDNNYPNKEVIVIDDGSSNEESWKTIKRLQEKFHYKAIRFKKNKGKREAMTAGFKTAAGEFLITMDSDTIITNGQSINELIIPFKDEKVGAVSGNVQVLNKNQSFLARIQWARYWLAFNVEKSSQSPYSSVTCCSGPFSAYRKEYLMAYLDEWSNQYFLGKKCTYGDDRGLTTLMLRSGYKVKFSRYALALTNVPTKFKQYIKQQIRWKKSFIRENVYLSKFMLKKNVFMQAEFFWFWILFLPGFTVKFIAAYYLIIGKATIFWFIIMLMFVSTLHYSYAFIRKPGEAGLLGIAYGFLNEFVLSWLFWYALFTLKETKWGTR